AAVQWARHTKLELQEAQVDLSRERREFREVACCGRSSSGTDVGGRAGSLGSGV
ncbi:unnamed protein product, partial [Prorocentrum cordatum]